MDRSGYRFQIPYELPDLQPDETFKEARLIGPISNSCSFSLSLLIGLIDCQLLSKIPVEWFSGGGQDESQMMNLLKAFAVNGADLLDHHCYTHFKVVPRLLEKAAQNLVNNCLQKSQQRSPQEAVSCVFSCYIGYTEAGRPRNPNAMFLVTARKEHYFNMYRSRETPRVKKLCCGCDYEQGDGCGCHSSEVINNATELLQPVACECAIEDRLLSGQELYPVAMVALRGPARTSPCPMCKTETVESDIHRCQNWVSCLSCLAKDILTQHPKIPGCKFCYMSLRAIRPNLCFDSSIQFQCSKCMQSKPVYQFLYRNRCMRDVVCTECCLVAHCSSNGVVNCPICNNGQSTPSPKCGACANSSSTLLVHAENGACTLCWNCAFSKWNNSLFCPDCQKPFSDAFIEMMLYWQKSFCPLCGLDDFPVTCGMCHTTACIFCISRNAPQCSECSQIPQRNERIQGCIYCFDLLKQISKMQCGHWGHQECFNRYGYCLKCPVTPQ